MTISFVTWYPSCRRSDALARALGGVSHLIHSLAYKQPWSAPLRYVINTFTTWRYLLRDRPSLVLVASPPVVSVLIVWLYTRVFGGQYVVDAHTGVFDDPRWTWLSGLSQFVARQAVATVVTNDFLKEKVESWGAQAVVIGDVPVEFQTQLPADLGFGFHVVVVNTFSQDEPLDEVLLAAEKFSDVRFHVTGDPRNARISWTPPLASNVRFTGWLPDPDYEALMLAADVIVSLTTQDHTMQRGGYEAMALEKPLITSDWPVLRQTFSSGTIHVENTAEAIVAAIAEVRHDPTRFVAEMGRLRRERRQLFHTKLNTLRRLLAGRQMGATLEGEPHE